MTALTRVWPTIDDFTTGTNGWTGASGTSTCGTYTLLGGYNVLGKNSSVDKTYNVRRLKRKRVRQAGPPSFFFGPSSFLTTMASASSSSSLPLTAVSCWGCCEKKNQKN